MFDKIASRVAALVTRHDLLVIVLALALTAGVGAGITQLDLEDQTAIDDEVFNQTTVGDGLQYIEANYNENETETALSSVYFRPTDRNALSRSTLIKALEYEQRVRADPAVRSALVAENPVRGPPNLVGEELAGTNSSLDEQIAAIESASPATLDEAIRAVFADRQQASTFLPRDYEPGTAEAESMRLHFEFEKAGVTQQQEPLPDEDAQQVLYDAAAQSEGVFTLGTIAQAEWDDAQISDVFLLIVPPSLLLVLVVLAFAYRDIVDVLLGFVGVCISVVWFFGILGWLGIPAGFASIIGPVLIVALSIDFGLHVFMRYREQRGSGTADDSIRAAMGRSTKSVIVAFLLVAVTAAVGFLANATNPVGFIRAFGIVITLGVLSSVFVFVTLIPALKLRIDETLQRYGVDREKTALGTRGWLKPVLSSGVDIARRGAAVVVILAVVAGVAGLATYGALDRQGFQEDFVSDDDWQTDLPEPVGWTAHETDYRQNLDYVQEQFKSDDDRDRTAFLIRGDVADVTALERVQAGTAATANSELTYRQNGAVPTISPLSLLKSVAIEDETFAAEVARVGEQNEAFGALLSELTADDAEFAAAIESASTAETSSLAQTGEGSSLATLYDGIYERAPDRASEVFEKRNGDYQSIRLLVPVEQGPSVDTRGAEMHRIADEIAANSELAVVPVGFATVANAGLDEITDSIIWTMLLALLGVTLVLAAMYRIEQGSATLGIVTVVPIVLVIGFVFAGMYLFDISLTFITAFMMSITIGLGIDYNIHVSDRFAQELDRGVAPVDALYTTVRGTGGALLGSALTSGAAFATLLIHPSPVFQSFGFIVVVALLSSFVMSVLVFPSLLLLWSRRVEI